VDAAIEWVTRGNVVEVKTALASVALALAVYQVLLIAVAYGRLRPPVLDAAPASAAHRASGDAIAVILVVVAFACLAYAGVEDGAALHMAAGTALLLVLGLKITVIRALPRLGHLLPLLGTLVLALLALTWATSAAGVLA